MDELEVAESPAEGIKTETTDQEAQLSKFPLSSGNSPLAQASMDQSIANPDGAETPSPRENSVEVVQVRSRAGNHNQASVEQAETSSFHRSNPIRVGSQAVTHHLEDLLPEARRTYGSERPPFAAKSCSRHRSGDKIGVLLAAEDGRYPQSHVKRAEVKYCSWDNKSVYGTMKIDGRTVIVKSVSGGISNYSVGGASYRQWLGVERGLSKLPIAHPQRGSSALPAAKRRASSAESETPPTEPSRKRILRASKPVRTSDSGILFNWTGDSDDANGRSLRQKVTQEATSTGATGSEPSSSSDSDDDDDTELYPKRKLSASGNLSGSFNRPSALPTPHASIPRTFSSYNNDTAAQLNENDDDPSYHNMDKDDIDALLLRLRNEGKTFEAIRNYIDEKTGQSTHPSTWWSRYRRIEQKQAKARREGEAARSGRAKVNQRRYSEPNPHDQEISEVASDKKQNITTRRTSRKVGRPARSTSVQQQLGNRSFNSAYESTGSALQTAQYAAPGTAGEHPQLAPHKLNHTTVRILHTGSFTPLKLRSCDTMQALFHTARDICSLDFAQERVNALKVTFPWMPKTDDSRSMLLREQYEDSFEVFLETVDEAPCWQSEAGKCTVDVEMV